MKYELEAWVDIQTEENHSTWRKPVPVPLYPLQIPHAVVVSLQCEGGD